MRLFYGLLRKKMPNGHIFRGKNRLVRQVTPDLLQHLKNEFRIEERNMFYLRHPYITAEQCRGHAKALGKPEKRMNALLMKQKPFKEHVSLETMLGHLRYKESWD